MKLDRAATRLRGVTAGALLILVPALAPAQADARAGRTAGKTVTGVVLDSLRGGFLRDAVVELQPGRREALTNAAGEFRITNVPAGTYSIRVLHSMLDTLGLAVVTPQFAIDSGQGEVVVPVSVPNVDRILESICPRAQRLRGPAAIVGFVRDPDTDQAVDSARISLVYEVNRDPLGMLKDPITREARPDSNGRFRICGLPGGIQGKLQVERKGIASSELPVETNDDLIALRGVSFSLSNRVRSVVSDSGRMMKIFTGNARLHGRVVNKIGNPVAGARVTVAGTNAVAMTQANGEFTLDSLPSGTQTLEVRKLSFSPAERAVDLTAAGGAPVTVTLDDFVPTLGTVRTVARRDQDLENVGFTRRKASQGGWHYEGEQINTGAASFTETLRMVPGLRVVRTGEWQDKYVVMDARDPSGCVNYVVDGNRWKTMSPGDIDDFVRPDEVQAIEVYRAATVPPEFAHPGDGKCVTVVIWTIAKVRPPNRR